MTLRSIALALLCLVLWGCTDDALLAKVEPHPQSELAKSLVDEVQAGDYAHLKALLNPQLTRDPAIDHSIDQFRQVLAQPIKSVKLVGAYTMAKFSTNEPKATYYNLTYEYELEKGWAVVNVQMVDSEGKTVVNTFHAGWQERSLEAVNAFSFLSKGAKHRFVLVLALANLALSFYALVICIRTPIPRKKWLWALFTLTGSLALTFNWTTGQFGYSFWLLHLPVSSWSSSLYSPIFIQIYFPLGAVWFLIRRRRGFEVQPPVSPPLTAQET